VLFLFYGNRDAPAFLAIVEGFRSALETAQNRQVQIFTESFAQERGYDPALESSMLQLLQRKYAERMDLVVAVGQDPLKFLLAERRQLFPKASLLYIYLGDPPHESTPNSTGVGMQIDLTLTAEAAITQNPGTRKLLLVSGSSLLDKAYLAMARRGLEEHLRRTGSAIQIQTLGDLPFDDTRKQLARLSPDTVPIAVTYYADSEGQEFVPARAVSYLSAACSRPLYGPFSSYLGRGIVGGSVLNVQKAGEELGRIASRALAGENVNNIPPVVANFQSFQFDYGQMKRWNIPLSQLPPGSTIINREYTFWELYKWYTVGSISFILIEAALIAFLWRLMFLRTRAAMRLAKHRDLEALTAELSTAFIDLPMELVNAQIEHGFQRLLAFLRLDRIGLFELAQGEASFRLLCSTTVPGVQGPPARVDLREMPWMLNELVEGRPGLYPPPGDLAVHPDIKRFVEDRRFASLGVFPMLAKGRLFGVLTFAALHRKGEWSPDVVQCLQTISNIFASALTRQRAEKEVRESEERFRLMADTAPALMWMSGTDKLCTYFNKGWLDFTGRGLDQELGNGWAEGVHPEDLSRCLETYNKAFVARCAFSMEYRLRRHDGEYRWFLDSGTPRWLQDGGFAGYIGVCVDIQDRKEAEQSRHELAGRLLRAQEAERSRIARELHDDIAQRLALLTIRLRQLEQEASQTSDQQRIGELRGQSKQLSMDVSHLSHLLHSSYLENLGLAAAVENQCRETAELHHLKIECQVRNLPPILDDDVSLGLFRVLQEALRNVIRHSHATQVKVELFADGPAIHLRITDDGVGFDPVAPGQGEGLGLVSMKERLRLVGGECSISSQPKRGTRVDARVPLPQQARSVSNQSAPDEDLNLAV
jgi:PAS domain S-box-containing protein